MRHYEVVVILDPELEERTVAPSLDTFLNVVKNDGGTVGKVDIWGRRRLAYEIDKKGDGIYALLDINCSAAAVAEAEPEAVSDPVSILGAGAPPAEAEARLVSAWLSSDLCSRGRIIVRTFWYSRMVSPV
jgi:small subunit ribosomal protein S6